MVYTRQDITLEEKKSSSNRFKNFLDKNKLCYFKGVGILAKNNKMVSPELYSIFVSVGIGNYVEKFNILFSIQKGFCKSEKAPRGYIFERLAYIQSAYSRQEAMNTLYCVHSVDDNVMLFKPLIWMLNYYNEVKKSNTEDRIKNNREYAIRIDPKERKEGTRDHLISCREREKHATTGNYNYHVGLQRQVSIDHKEQLIITEKEMGDFFKQHNSYLDTWKLKFKVAINLLTEGELI